MYYCTCFLRFCFLNVLPILRWGLRHCSSADTNAHSNMNEKAQQRKAYNDASAKQTQSTNTSQKHLHLPLSIMRTMLVIGQHRRSFVQSCPPHRWHRTPSRHLRAAQQTPRHFRILVEQFALQRRVQHSWHVQTL